MADHWPSVSACDFATFVAAYPVAWDRPSWLSPSLPGLWSLTPNFLSSVWDLSVTELQCACSPDCCPCSRHSASPPASLLCWALTGGWRLLYLARRLWRGTGSASPAGSSVCAQFSYPLVLCASCGKTNQVLYLVLGRCSDVSLGGHPANRCERLNAFLKLYLFEILWKRTTRHLENLNRKRFLVTIFFLLALSSTNGQASGVGTALPFQLVSKPFLSELLQTLTYRGSSPTRHLAVFHFLFLCF